MTWTETDIVELWNLFHTARVALSGTPQDTKHGRKVWAANEFAKTRPGVTPTAAYKQFDRSEKLLYRAGL
jgi:hypothetical protein